MKKSIFLLLLILALAGAVLLLVFPLNSAAAEPDRRELRCRHR